MRVSLSALLLCSTLGAAQAASIDPQTLTAAVTMHEVSQPGRPGKAFAAGTLIDAPLATVCTLIQDYPAYPRFMPNTSSTVVSSSGPGFSVIDVTLSLPMKKVKKYRLRMTPRVAGDSCTLAWKMVPWPGLKQEETIADTSGQWQLSSAAGGKTAVLYAVHTDPGPVPFGLGWIVDSMSKDSIPQMIDAVRKRAAGR